MWNAIENMGLLASLKSNWFGNIAHTHDRIIQKIEPYNVLFASNEENAYDTLILIMSIDNKDGKAGIVLYNDTIMYTKNQQTGMALQEKTIRINK